MVDAWLVRGYMTAVEQANAAKQRRNSLPSADDVYAMAWRRVQKSPRLRKYSEIIFGDWPEGDDHLRWVINVRVSDIEAWAKVIARDVEE